MNEDLSIKDAEILTLIEERRSTPKDEKQRLKEVSKCKKVSETKKNEKANGYPKNSWRLKRKTKYPGNQISKEESTHHKDKKRERGMHHISERNCRCLWKILQKLYKDNEKDESEQVFGEDENNSSTDVHNNNTEKTTRILEVTTEELHTAINKLKKKRANPQTAKVFEPKYIRACDDETREVVRKIFKEERIHP